MKIIGEGDESRSVDGPIENADTIRIVMSRGLKNPRGFSQGYEG